jgi:hypothetical protein
MPTINITRPEANPTKENRAYAEISADGREEVNNVHVLVPGLVVHHPHRGQRAPVPRPEVALVVAEYSLYLLPSDVGLEFLRCLVSSMLD